jgi:catechol 2,3-dioxygenase-like lactoylglutathione lyase family enzyme
MLAVPNRVVFNHVGQCVSDLARSRRFYVELLGFELWREISPPDDATAKLLGLSEPLGLTACYLRRDGLVLELLHFGARAVKPQVTPRSMDELGLTHISVSCDVADICRLIADYGGQVLSSTDIGNAVFVRDPDGQLVELLPLAYADSFAPPAG